MRYWLAGLCLCVSFVSASAQQDEAAKANALWLEGKHLDALPFYEDLARDHADQWLYAERLAVALQVKAQQSSDPSEIKALHTRMCDSAKRAVQLGDPNYFVQLMANVDVNAPALPLAVDEAHALLHDAEKAFGVGDYATALAKYSQAADADPKLYEAPLYAGDTAYSQKDLRMASIWFARAISVDPNRETAYRYWGDAIVKYGSDPMAAKDKFIDALVAEPYNKLAWQGITQWATRQKAVILSPHIDRPSSPVVDPSKPNNITINIDSAATDDKRHPGASAWMMYSIVRASYHGDLFKKEFPDATQYRHTLKEEDAALSLVASTVAEKKIKPEKLDDSLRNLLELQQAGMLDCWILINGADRDITQDYEAYRNAHRQLLHDYLARFVVHGGINPTQ
jgi:tetratricopeptide (TPR) repeat protein